MLAARILNFDRLSRLGKRFCVLEALKKHIPDLVDDRGKLANDLVPRALDEEFGNSWETERRPAKSGTVMTTWVVIK